ncbi:hypothetical protein N7G274_009082 [Stereocaulon virgatum]|uniref:Alpha/beta hydrolase fold-3 domain-containing protein n=1 Tax=Stereocaulon virgatum TaxID=373712 RepID=A0ABR3ZX07_9LECA
MTHAKPKLSLWEKAVLIAAIIRTLGTGFCTALIAPFRGSTGSAKYGNHVKIAMIRSFMKHTTTRQQQVLNPSLDEAYPAYAKKEGFKPQNITLTDGTKAYWIGNPSADKVLLWFNGGGYALPPNPAHFTFASSLVSAASPSLAVLMISYTLTPHKTYPHQLRQGVECVRFMISNLHLRPENISIGGDSAGANLAIGVLSHLMHPHKDITPLELSGEGRLGAAILLAAWCTFRTDYPSRTYNENKDIVSATLGDRWSESFLGGKDRDAYNEPLSAPEDWWNGLEGVVREILICGGADEILVDPIRELGEKFKAVHKNTTVFIADGEWHDMPTVDALGGGGKQAAAVKAFVKSRL